jgi:hypothetical protein
MGTIFTGRGLTDECSLNSDVDVTISSKESPNKSCTGAADPGFS